MHFLNILPLALTANAFLVPTEIHEHVEITRKLPASALHETVELECAGCPIILTNSKSASAWRKAVSSEAVRDTKLVVDVQIQDDKVLFNGQQVWPTGVSPPLAVKQIGTEDIKDAFKDLIAVSTSLEYKEQEVIVDKDSHMTIHPISIEILALANKVVEAESVELRIAETEAGLGLLPSRIRAYESSPYTESCTTVWCRVKGTLAEKLDKWRLAASNKINKWRGCSGQKQRPGHFQGIPVKGGPAKFGPGSTLHKHLPGGEKHHGHHHGHHGLRSAIRRFVRTILLPAILGLGAGLIIGAFSWLVVTEIKRIRAGRRGQYAVIEQIEEGRGSIDGPPKYEEVYHQAQDVAEDEKKELLP